MKCPMKIVIFLTVILLIFSICLFYLCYYFRNNLIYAIMCCLFGCILIICSCVSAFYSFFGSTRFCCCSSEETLGISSGTENEENTDQSLHRVNSSNWNPRKEGSNSQSHKRHNLASKVNTGNMGANDPSEIVSRPGREEPLQFAFDDEELRGGSLASKVNTGNMGANDPSKIVSTPGREQDSQLPFEEENTDQSLHCVNSSNSNRCKKGSDSQSHQRDKNLASKVNTGNMGSNEPPTIVSKSGRKEDDDLQFRMSGFEDSNSSNSDPRKEGSDSQSHQRGKNLASEINTDNMGSNNLSTIVSTSDREDLHRETLHRVNSSNSNPCKEGSYSQSHQRDKNLASNVNTGNKGSNEPPTIVSKSGRKEDDLQFRMSNFEDNSSNSDSRKEGSDSQSHQRDRNLASKVNTGNMGSNNLSTIVSTSDREDLHRETLHRETLHRVNSSNSNPFEEGSDSQSHQRDKNLASNVNTGNKGSNEPPTIVSKSGRKEDLQFRMSGFEDSNSSNSDPRKEGSDSQSHQRDKNLPSNLNTGNMGSNDPSTIVSTSRREQDTQFQMDDIY